MTGPMNGAEILTSYTLFRGVMPTTKTERADVPWSELVERIENAPTFPSKAECPLISMAEYGDALSANGCIRHAANVRRIFGWEADYDGGLVTPEEAAALFEAARIECTIYTTPSHTASLPRWRAVGPTSDPDLPEKRAEYVGRANRILGGILTRESFTLSQSFYIGRVEGAPYKTITVHGRPIDLATEFEPLYFAGNGSAGAPATDPTTDADLRTAFARGEDRYQAMLKLSSRWAARGMDRDDIAEALYALLEESPRGATNGDGVDLRSRVSGMAESAWRKFGETRAPAAPSPPDREQQERDKQAPRPEAPLSLIAFALEDILKPIRQETYLLPGMVPTDAYTLIAGALSSYKTMLLINLLVWRATGYDLLGLDTEGRGCDMGPCVLVSYEDTDWRIYARLQRILQHGHESVGQAHGRLAANEFLERAAKNLRRLPLTGKFGQSLVYRYEGAIHPNHAFLDNLLNAVRAYTEGDVLLGLDPLRLAIVGSQNDDDGADVVVHVLNMIAGELPGSGLAVCSHTTKAGAQEPAAGYTGAAYATSGSALYSQHARSNFLMTRLKSDEIRRLFDPADVSPADADRQVVAKLTHGRLSHGLETAELYVRMHASGVLAPVQPQGARTAVDTINRALPLVADAITRLVGTGIPVSAKVLEADTTLTAAIGGRDAARSAVRLLAEAGYVEFSGTTTDRRGALTDTGREYLARIAPLSRESPRESSENAK